MIKSANPLAEDWTSNGMKKSLVIILAVAIIGGLGVYTKSHNSSASTATPAQTSNVSTVSSSGSTPAPSSTNSTSKRPYTDGTFTGKNVSTEYGDVQLAAVISGGRIVDVKLLQMPNGLGHTQEVTDVSAPLLKQSAISKQSAHIDFVSGATQTSQAYETSLQSALDQAM